MRITSEYEDTNLPPLAEGPVRARVAKITLQPVKAGKEYPSIRVDFKIQVPMDQSDKALADGTRPQTEFISLAPQAGWKLEEFLKACGCTPGVDYTSSDIDAKRKRIEWDTERVEGRELMLLLSQEPEKDSLGNVKPGGRIFNRTQSFGSV